MNRQALGPGFQQALLDLLSAQSPWRRSPTVLTVGAALEELAITLEEVANGRSAPQTADRGSLTCDVDLALTRAGERLRGSMSPGLTTLRREELTKLASILDDSDECRRVAELTRDILRCLRTDVALQAAWDDLVATVADAAKSADECVLAADQLTELLVAQGHELWSLYIELRERVRKGELDGARELVAERPPDDATVAWVAFGNAALPRGVVRVGQVRFFDARYDLKALRDRCTEDGDAELAPVEELGDHQVEMYFSDVEAEHVVFARVELTGHREQDGRLLPPVTWAREIASSLVEAAGFRHGGTDWVLLNGGCYFTARGTDGGTAGFTDPRRQEERERESNPRWEPTGSQLRELPAGLVQALAEGQPAARDASEAIRWHRDVERLSDPRKRVALYVRRFEVQWSTGDPNGWRTWEEALRYHLKDVWSRKTQNDVLFRVGLRLYRTHHLAHPRSGAGEAAARVHKNVGDGFAIDRKETVRVASEVAGGFPAGSFERRLLKEVARRTADGRAAQRWWEEVRRDFDVLLNRAVRQRNRVIHGRQPVPAVIESVDAFVSGCSATLAAQAVASAADERPVQDALAERRQVLAERFAALADEESGLALFGPDGRA